MQPKGPPNSWKIPALAMDQFHNLTQIFITFSFKFLPATLNRASITPVQVGSDTVSELETLRTSKYVKHIKIISVIHNLHTNNNIKYTYNPSIQF